MKCLVTGGAGFIGSHLVRQLLSRGNQVTVLDNFSSGKRENLEGLTVNLIEGDVRDYPRVTHAVEDVDLVFHQAALCSVALSMTDPRTTHDVNVTGTLNVLEACRHARVKRVVVASSSAVYGNSELLPKHEEMRTEPLSPYAISKLIGEHYCELYWKTFGLETVALRYFNVFGPGQSPESDYAAVIPKFVQAIISGAEPRIYGDGSQTRDFTYVEDVVAANIAAATSPGVEGEVMNIACARRLSLLDLLNLLEDLLNCHTSPIFLEARAGDVEHSQASISRARKLIGFNPHVGMEEGLRETVNWFLRTREAERTASLEGRQPAPRQSRLSA